MPYLEPGLSELNGLRHLYLMCWDYKNPMPIDDMRYYVAHRNEEGREIDWLFDSFAAFTGKAPSGNALHNDINLGTTMSGEGDFFAVPSPNPGTRQDWGDLLDAEFNADGMFDRLDKAVDEAAEILGPPPRPRNVVVTIPYPHPNQVAFDGTHRGQQALNFGVVNQNLMQASQQRLEACKWFVDETIRRWKETGYRNLELLGFYWMYESIHYAWTVDDHWVLKELYKYIRSRGCRLFWIPFYSSWNVNMLQMGKGFYFDAAFLQPNHMFYVDIPGVEQAAREAKERGAGIELEYYMHLDEHIQVGGERLERFRNYLDGGVKYGYMTESACAYFMGFNDLHKIAHQEEDAERQIYHDVCKFVRGVYTPEG